MLDHLTGRITRAAAQTAVVTAVVGGSVGYAGSGRNISLALDGRPTAVRSEAVDVRGLFADEGLTVTGRDLVVPSLDSPLVDGQRVAVRFARPLTITLDGAPRTYWTTELTVDAAMDSLGIRADGARTSVSRSMPLGRKGAALVVSTPKRVTVVADRRTRRVTTTATTVAELLQEQGITVRSVDRLSVLPATPVVDGLVVALTRIDRREEKVRERIAPAVVRRRDTTLARGRTKVLAAGRAGVRRAVYTVVLADGRQVSRTLTSRVIVQQPVNRVVKVGTATAAAARRSVSGADGLNWRALAQCESGGNPRAINPAGYYGLYQFSPSTWRSVGGRGLPHRASAAEQLYRAKILYARGGARQWGCGHRLFG